IRITSISSENAREPEKDAADVRRGLPYAVQSSAAAVFASLFSISIFWNVNVVRLHELEQDALQDLVLDEGLEELGRRRGVPFLGDLDRLVLTLAARLPGREVARRRRGLDPPWPARERRRPRLSRRTYAGSPSTSSSECAA